MLNTETQTSIESFSFKRKDPVESLEDFLARPVRWGPIGLEVFKRTYSQNTPSGTKETWPETVVRVVDGNLGLVNTRFHEAGEREALIKLLFDMGGLPAGRHLSASGRIGRQFLFNCHNSHYDVTDPSAHFTFLFDQLMQGGGVGANYSNRYMDEMPSVKRLVDLHITCDLDHPNIGEFDTLLSKHAGLRPDHQVTVDDSREGWVDSVGSILRLAFGESAGFAGVDPEATEAVLTIDVTKIRARGLPLKTSGGIACGPGHLVETLIALAKRINGCFGRRLTSLDTMALDHDLAACVIAGGKRRSSRMSVKNWKDSDIFEFINCKSMDGLHWSTNISVETDDEYLAAYSDQTHEWHSHARRVARAIVLGKRENGEPGLWNRSLTQGENDKNIASPNPCQIADAPVLTPDGIRTMGEVRVGDTIWSGQRWTIITNKMMTGVKPAFAYRTRAGTFYGTANHRVVSNGVKVEVAEAESIDTNTGPPTKISDLDSRDIMDGLMLGDGYFEKKLGGNYLIVGAKDQDYFTSEVKDLLLSQPPDSYHKGMGWKVESTIVDPLPKTYSRQVPERFYRGDQNKVRGFLRGLYSANGSVIDSYAGRVTLKASSFDVIEAVQEMLSSIGISAYYTVNKAHDVEFANGTYSCKQSYDLNITGESKRLFKKAIGFIQADKSEKLTAVCACEPRDDQRKKSYEIVSVESLGEQEVFDVTVEADEHTYWTGGLLVSNCGEIGLDPWENCNLGHINMEYFAPNPSGYRPVMAMKEAFRLMARWLVRATFGDIPQPRQRKVVDKNRRIGVGFFGYHAWLALHGVRYSEGYQSSWVINTLTEMKQTVIDSATSYANKLGIPVPVKFTTLAPTGTTATLPGTTSSGQSMMAPWFKRLVRYSDMDPRLPVLRMEGIEVFPDDDAKNTSIAVFWCEDPLVAKVRAIGFDPADVLESQYDISMETSLATQAMFQDVYVDNAVSFTINLRPEDMPNEEAMEGLLMKYLPRLKGTTVFPEKSRKNTPIQPITKADFDAHLGPKQITAIEIECVGGCPVK